jgi:hypothetical protein
MSFDLAPHSPNLSKIAILYSAVCGRPVSAEDMALAGPTWSVWRAGGRAVSSRWREEPKLSRIFSACLADPEARRSDSLEICLTFNYRPVSPDAFATVFTNSARGRTGIEIRQGNFLRRVAPTQSIATNRRFSREVEIAAERLGSSTEKVLSRARISAFDAWQIFLRPGEPPRAMALYRGNRIVPPEFATAEGLAETLEGLSRWLLGNLHANGRMTYKYWPSRGAESGSDNSIRQFMATVALTRLAVARDDEAAAEAAGRNLRYNLERFYREIDGLGAIVWEGKAKLGAAALAALAILEQMQAGMPGAEAHRATLDRLNAGIEALWQEDGSFRTFLVPPERNDNQNFYPGEALLYWASLHRHTRDSDLAEKCRRSFRFYRDWHLAQPNPAFVPWHTQADVMLFEDLGDRDFADFVLERNDWLLGMQQWAAPLDPDLWGRFYDPMHPEYGPPHASSTGVYMEGLADAWRLARTLGDTARAEAYATALRRGLRAIRQLQFADPEIDAFYVQRKDRVLGGLRTEAYNNEIRVDNVQHCLMALLKLAAEPAFPWPDVSRQVEMSPS